MIRKSEEKEYILALEKAKSDFKQSLFVLKEELRPELFSWPEKKLENFQLFCTPDNLDYPEIADWASFSEIYLDAAKPKTEAHLFFQDSLTPGNYFWDHELPRARKKGLTLVLHQYDVKEHKWNDDKPLLYEKKQLELIDIPSKQIANHLPK
jgi:hypothetical protein